MRPLLLLLLISFAYLTNTEPAKGQDSLLNIIIVAGQSNSLNWHADAQELDKSYIDQNIPFYYHTGLPPDREFEVPFNATSDSVWTKLAFQSQQPFIKYFADFFGPEMTLAQELFKHIPNLAVFKCAYGGSNLALDWDKGNSSGNQLYDTMLGHFNHATAILEASGIQFKVVGLFWMQGESDAANVNYALDYESNLKNFIQNIRTDVDNPTLKVTLGRIGAQLPAPYLHKEAVRLAQMKVAEEDTLVTWVSIDDQVMDTDDIHLLAGGVKVLGERMAIAWTNLTPTSLSESENEYTLDFSLQNYPNPFNPTTTIQFTLPKASFVTIKIYDLLGRELRVLTQRNFSSGKHNVVFDANQFTTGIYVYEIQSGIYRDHKFMTLIK